MKNDLIASHAAPMENVGGLSALTPLQPNQRGAQEGPRSVLRGVLFEGLLFLLTPVFVAAMALSAGVIVRIAARLPLHQASVPALDLLLLVVVATTLGMVAMFREIVPMWLGSLEHVAQRAICVFLASFNEVSRLGRVVQNVVYLTLVAVAVGLGLAFMHSLVDGTAAGAELKRILLD